MEYELLKVTEVPGIILCPLCFKKLPTHISYSHLKTCTCSMLESSISMIKKWRVCDLQFCKNLGDMELSLESHHQFWVICAVLCNMYSLVLRYRCWVLRLPKLPCNSKLPWKFHHYLQLPLNQWFFWKILPGSLQCVFENQNFPLPKPLPYHLKDPETIKFWCSNMHYIPLSTLSQYQSIFYSIFCHIFFQQLQKSYSIPLECFLLQKNFYKWTIQYNKAF